ncbi:MAG: adenylate/guanylate cyclase domain-containing protein [Phaeodactylibacter sp.]|uniref:adenylate/guanylate cyclase domain-containing protein n=1 Tax=Phaeodactylibacter sp. TaxID=1940289 RepID=UPI0032ECAE64
MRKILFTLLLLWPTLAIQAQTKFDSLYSIWQDETQTDSIRVDAFKTYIWDGYLYSEPDSALVLTEAMVDFGEKRNYPKAVNQAYTLQSIAYEMQGDFTKAMELAERSIAANEKIGNKAGISEAEIVMGVLWEEQGIYPQALERYNRALAIDEEINNREGMAMSLNNIGNIFNTQGNSSKALEYYKKALAIDEELGIKQGIAVEVGNIGSIYQEQGDTEKALEFFERSLKLNQEIGDNYGVASTYGSLASLYQQEGNAPKALLYYQKALSAFEELGTLQEVARNLNQIGLFHMRQGDYNQALKYCRDGYKIAKELGAIVVQELSCQCLYGTYKELGNEGKALTYFEERIILKDSIYNEENTRKLTQAQMQYEFSRKEAARQAEQEKKDAIALEELERQKLVRNGFMGGFAVVLLFAGVFFIQRNRIGKEKQRSEELLLNILPEETAQELKEKGHADAKLINQVTVLFTDFKGFTAMSEQLSPKELVRDLHECFSLFDQICEKHGIEKIKTIGDSYMAAGGLPSTNHTHATDVVEAALEMVEVVEKGKAGKIARNLPYFEVRVGVHTGPVVAGIVGVKKFQYDIWGDTVNTASRMESSGEVGSVNISQATYELLKHNPTFTFKSRGKIKAKGKGEVEMHFASKA